MEATSPKVLIAGDWGLHRFEFNGHRAEANCGSKLIELALRALVERVTVATWLSARETIPKAVFQLKMLPRLIDGQPDSKSAKVRIAGAPRNVPSEGNDVTLDYRGEHPGGYDTLIIHDAAGAWRKNTTKEQITRLLNPEGRDDMPQSNILVHVCDRLPDVQREIGHPSVQFRDEVWKTLDTTPGVKERVHVICSMTPVRKAGCAVSRRLSWEQTVEDLAAELFLSDQLRALSRFCRLTIRLGHAATVHLDLGGRVRNGQLIFAPEAKDGIHRDPAEDGRVIGKNLLIVAALLNKDFPHTPREEPDQESDYRFRKEVGAIKCGLLAGMELFDKGYDFYDRDPKPDDISKALCTQEISDLVRDTAEAPPRERAFVSVRIPCSVLRRPPAITGIPSTWEILRDQINYEPEGERSSESAPNRINIGTAIVLHGTEGSGGVLNRSFDPIVDKDLLQILHRHPCIVTAEEPGDHVTLPPQRKPLMPDADAMPPRTQDPKTVTEYPPIITPIARFGRLITVEREDIESFRSIQNILKNHLHEYVELRNHHRLSDLKPLNIAVFGPPGAGKSFAVTEIIESINVQRGENAPKNAKAPKIEFLDANLSQFRGVDDLEKLFRRVQACLIKNTSLPLVFFDEFDTEHFKVPLGWLKHFLAPMQDGRFVPSSGDPINLFGAVFIFAGGTYARFEDFDPSEPPGVDRNPTDSAELQQRMRDFKDRKGPDFVSRLRGHMNIHAVDAPDGHTKHIIRRALTLRGILEARAERPSKSAKRHAKQASSHERREASEPTQASSNTLIAQSNDIKIHEDIVYALLTVDRYKHGARSMTAILDMCTRIDGEIQKVSLPSRKQLNMHVDADEFFVRMHRSRFRAHIDNPDERAQEPTVTPQLATPVSPQESGEDPQGGLSKNKTGLYPVPEPPLPKKRPPNHKRRKRKGSHG